MATGSVHVCRRGAEVNLERSLVFSPSCIVFVVSDGSLSERSEVLPVLAVVSAAEVRISEPSAVRDGFEYFSGNTVSVVERDGEQVELAGKRRKIVVLPNGRWIRSSANVDPFILFRRVPSTALQTEGFERAREVFEELVRIRNTE